MTRRTARKLPVKSSVASPMRRDDAYDRILDALIFGDLLPGEPIDEKQLAHDFQLGVAGIRNALYRLSLEGLVERHARIGTLAANLGIGELQDVFETRVMLEGGCARIAAQRASPEDIASLRAAFEGYENAIERRDYRNLVRMDQAFHRAIAKSTRNRLLARQLAILHNNASRFWFFGMPRIDPSALLAEIRAHLDVVDAIERRDPAAAEAAMRNILEQFPSYIEFYFRDGHSK